MKKYLILICIITLLAIFGNVDASEFIYYNNPNAADQGIEGDKTFKSLINSIGPSKKVTIVAKHLGISDETIHTVSTSVDFTSNIQYSPEWGAILDGAGTITFDNPGQIDALPNQQVFGPSITVIFTNPGDIPVQWFGAKDDILYDSHDAIEAAAAAAAANSTILIGNATVFATDSEVTIPANLNVKMETTLYYKGSSNEPCLTIGGAVGSHNQNVTLQLKVGKYVQSDWSSKLCVGVKLINTYESNIYLQSIGGFTIGAMCIGDGAGFVYNNIKIGRLINNKYPLYFTNDNDGWCNENVTLGGKFTVNSGINETLTRYGIVITSEDGEAATHANDNNFFIKPSIEISSAGTTGSDIVLFDFNLAKYCRVTQARCESSVYSYIASFGKRSTHNIISIGYGFDTSNIQDDAWNTNHVVLQSAEPFDSSIFPKLIFDSGNLAEKAIYYTGKRLSVTDKVSWTNAGSANLSKYSSSDGEILDKSLYSTNNIGVGIMIDTSTYKRFLLRSELNNVNGGRWFVRCYDASGSVLTGVSPLYVNGVSQATADWGGVYYSPLDGSGHDITEEFISFHDDVKYAYVFVGRFTYLNLKSFRVYCYDGIVNSWSGLQGFNTYAGENNFVPRALSSPAQGKFVEGKIIFDDTPTSGGKIGWVCVNRADTTLSVGEPVSETSIAVTNGSDTANNDIIGVLQDDGTIHWSTISSGGGSNTLVIAEGLVSAAASGNSVYTLRWKTFGGID